MATFLLHNHRILPETEFTLAASNRAFQYNDGVFETLILHRGQVRFLHDHLDRLRRALAVLKMHEPPLLNAPEEFSRKIQELAHKNGLGGEARVKWKVWRAGKGLFTPETSESELLVTVQPHVLHAPIIQLAGFCTSIRNQFSPLSFFKGPYALHYVLAAVERKEKKWEEIILLDQQGHVAECGTANVFWLQHGTLYTPALPTGCIDGVMRTNVLRVAQEHGLVVQEGLYSPEEMLAAELVFSSNVTGLYPMAQVEGQMLATKHPVLEQVAKKLG